MFCSGLFALLYEVRCALDFQPSEWDELQRGKVKTAVVTAQLKLWTEWHTCSNCGQAYGGIGE